MQRDSVTGEGDMSLRFRTSRLGTSIWAGLAGGLVSLAANSLIYAHDPRRFSRSQLSVNTYVLVGGLFAGGLWTIRCGAVAGSNRTSVASAVITSLVVLGLWVGIFGTYQDVLWTAVSFGDPFAGIVGALVSSSDSDEKDASVKPGPSFSESRPDLTWSCSRVAARCTRDRRKHEFINGTLTYVAWRPKTHGNHSDLTMKSAILAREPQDCRSSIQFPSRRSPTCLLA